MSARKYSASAVAVTIAASTFALVAGSPASADPAFTPTAADIVGVGSDTSMFALNHLADGTTVGGVAVPGYNDQAGATNRLASFDAIGGSATIVLQEGHPAVNRSLYNGSGNGKKALYGATNNPDVDFARSSSALNATEVSNNLFAYPFALDTMVMVTAQTTNAPATLTEAQIVDIYQGDLTNWSQIGGADAPIQPYMPQSGSGTYSFFQSELTRMNGGVAVTSSAPSAQEHDDTLIKDNPNAVAPFSVGRADLLGTLRVEGGEFRAKRALYNVVRQANLSDPDIQAIFGQDGFVCSTGARSLVEAAGFQQLARSAAGGVCGEPTQAATSNFTTNEAVTSATSLVAASPAAGAIRLTATVTADGGADGTVEFFEAETKVGETGVVQSQAVLDLTGVATGQHTYQAVFVPTAGTAFEGSESALVEVVAKAASMTTVAFTPLTSAYGKSRVVKATVLTGGIAATGTVGIKVGTAAAVNVALVNGVGSLTVPASKAAGTYAVVTTYAGNTTTASSTAGKSLVIAKAAPTVTESFPTATTVGGRGKGVVKVAITGSTVKPTGKVTIKLGTRIIVAAKSLVNGQVTITLPRLAKGRRTVTIVYSGSANVKAKSQSFVITQR